MIDSNDEMIALFRKLSPFQKKIVVISILLSAAANESRADDRTKVH